MIWIHCSQKMKMFETVDFFFDNLPLNVLTSPEKILSVDAKNFANFTTCGLFDFANFHPRTSESFRRHKNSLEKFIEKVFGDKFCAEEKFHPERKV